MNIAFVTLGFGPFRTSGLDVSGDRLVGGLLKAGCQISVIAGQRQPLDEIYKHPRLNIYRLPIGRSNWIGFCRRAADYLGYLESREKFDAVHFWDVHFAYTYKGKYIASVQHSFQQRLSSLDWRTTPIRTFLTKAPYYIFARRFAELPAVRKARGFIAGSSATRQEFIAEYQIPPEKIVVAPHGIDTDFFSRQNPEPLRKRLGLLPEEPVILFTGYIVPRKGLEFLAQALPSIKPRVKWVLAGEWRSLGYRQYILDTLGEHQNQLLEVGLLPDTDMPALYSLADIYVSPSLLEGFGIPPAEAMACETPVVVTTAGAAPEVAGPGGILVPPGNPAALAAAVNELLASPIRRRELGLHGRAHVMANFSLQRMVQIVMDSYQIFR